MHLIFLDIMHVDLLLITQAVNTHKHTLVSPTTCDPGSLCPAESAGKAKDSERETDCSGGEVVERFVGQTQRKVYGNAGGGKNAKYVRENTGVT